MKLVSIEPTPNPNSMKLNLDESLPKGVSRTYTADDCGGCPDYIDKLLNVPGVKSLFHLADFIAVQRDPHMDWQGILARARRALAGDKEVGTGNAAEPIEAPKATFGEVRVEVQMFRGIPMLLKLSAGNETHRQALPEAFTTAVNRAAPSSPNMLMERTWVDQGVRYGDLHLVAREVVEEIAAAYDDRRLEELVTRAFAAQLETAPPDVPARQVTQLSADPDWRVRYAVLERIGPRREGIPLLVQALRDPQSVSYTHLTLPTILRV